MTVSSVKATINGTEYTLTYNSTSGKYEATITAPTQTSGMNNAGVGPGVGSAASGKGYYPVSVVATDLAGNSTTVDDTHATLGSSCQLKVKETTAPEASVTYPTAGAYVDSARPTFTFTVTDSGSGVKADTCVIIIDSGSAIPITLSGSGSSFSGSYQPSAALNDGQHSVKVYAYDYDGNKSNEATIQFYIDTAPPELNVTSPIQNHWYNNASLNVEGTTSDANGVTAAITLNGVDQGAVTITSGSFSKAVTLAEGENTIIVTVTDGSGKTSSVTRVCYLDTVAPVISAISIQPNPSDVGESYLISVTVSDS